MKTIAVYKIQFKTSPRFYIGSSVDFYRRKTDHLRDLRNKRHCNIQLQRAYEKYGLDSISIEILQIVGDKQNLIQCEQVWIDKYDFKLLYNINKVAGSCLGNKLSQKTKDKISASNKKGYSGKLGEVKRELASKKQLNWLKKNPPNRLGCKLSEESKQRISNSLKGRKMSQDRIDKCQQGKLSKYGEQPRNIKVKQICLETGETIKTFNSMTEASKSTGCSIGKISLVCSGKRSKTGGYGWSKV